MTRMAALLSALAALAFPAVADAAETRYSLTKGCFTVAAGDRHLAKSGPAYRAGADAAGAERFRLQATALGSYLLYGREGDYLSGDGAAAREASPAADWAVTEAGTDTFVLRSEGRALQVAADGSLVRAGEGTPLVFRRADGCATYPEVEVNAAGTPTRGATSHGEVAGLVDAHLHMMAFEFLGGQARCGRPWHPYGAPYALVDCPDHQPNGAGAVLENAQSYGTPARTHDPTGWPTFKDWPHWASLTHEQVYYKWLERSWRGGLRLFTNLLVDNAVLCEIYPLKRNSCNEMDGVRLQAQRIRELENYIDAQEGGPGKGWFRIVKSPFEARQVINDGKLAVVLGIEVSKLFDCGRFEDLPECSSTQIDQRLDEVLALGVRQMELVNKFDNALSGVAGDEGQTGVVTNTGNKYETGEYWDMKTCTGHDPSAHDREQVTTDPTHNHNDDQLLGNGLAAFLGDGNTPFYGPAPHCNQLGLTQLGEHLVRRMMDKNMLIDPDHMSVLGRNQLLSLTESRDYPGVISSHSWSTPDAMPRIYQAGGFITPYAGASTTFVDAWKALKAKAQKGFYFGFGYGADTNGFGKQGPPRGEDQPNKVTYPFKSFDGKVTLDRQKSGSRVFDINKDGVAHYGLYPDWIEDLRKLAGDEIVRDMGRGAEAYLQTWERATGIRNVHCQAARHRFTRNGLGRVVLGATPEPLLRSAGQPAVRQRAWTWCITRRGAAKRAGRVSAVMSKGERATLIVSTGPESRVSGVGRLSRASLAEDAFRPFGRGIRVRSAGNGRRYFMGVRNGRVRFTGLATATASKTPGTLRANLRHAGLRP